MLQHMSGGVEMPQSPTLARIRAGLTTLGPREQLVARAILSRPQAVADMSTAELAALSGTSPATVIRGCQRLGFRGFQHLRLELARVSSSESGTPSTPLDEAFSAASDALVATRANVDGGAFDRAVTALIRADRVLMLGNGFSSPPIQDAALRFVTAGRSVEAPVDILAQQFSARLLAAGDTCLAVSYSGANTHTLRACAAAADRGATVIAVTSYAHSPLTRLADHVLWAGAGLRENDADSFASRVSQSVILYALHRAILCHPEATPLDSAAREVVADALSEDLPST